LNAATALDLLRVPPANLLEALKGNRRGQHSIRINSRWQQTKKNHPAITGWLSEVLVVL
jgi:plasmid maintenance system killer protein